MGRLAVAARAAAGGIALQPLSRHYSAAAPLHGLMFGYSAVAPERAAPAMRRLAELW